MLIVCFHQRQHHQDNLNWKSLRLLEGEKTQEAVKGNVFWCFCLLFCVFCIILWSKASRRIKYIYNPLPPLKDAQIRLKDAHQTTRGSSLFTYCVDLVRKQPTTCWELSRQTKIFGGKRFQRLIASFDVFPVCSCLVLFTQNQILHTPNHLLFFAESAS